MSYSCILTCEHAGNEVPDKFASLFDRKEEVLYSHKAMDFGALRLSSHLASALELPHYFTSTTRLLVEANRSLDNDQLFSEYTKKLPEKDKELILATYYHPHRKEVEQKIREETEKGNKVVHLAIHTFTPVLEGEVREAEIGILFDPDRPLEVTVADIMKKQLVQENPERKVLYNSPYPGVDDGFPTYLRTKFSPDNYAGFEIEVNQKFFLDGNSKVWDKVMQEMTAAVKKLV